MELTSTHLRYLLTIYQLSRVRPEISSAAVAGALGVSRPSVTRMLGILAEKDLVTKERYGKLALTDRGAALARRQLDCVRLLALRLPALIFHPAIGKRPKGADRGFAGFRGVPVSLCFGAVDGLCRRAYNESRNERGRILC